MTHRIELLVVFDFLQIIHLSIANKPLEMIEFNNPECFWLLYFTFYLIYKYFNTSLF